MPLNCTVKKVKIVNFTLHVFYHNKNPVYSPLECKKLQNFIINFDL